MSVIDPSEIQEDVVVTSIRVLYLQVCAHSEIPPEQVEKRANELEPTGLQSSWTIVRDGGVENPVPCRGVNDELTGRAHWVLSC